jgi:hypothetical protein
MKRTIQFPAGVVDVLASIIIIAGVFFQVRAQQLHQMYYYQYKKQY